MAAGTKFKGFPAEGMQFLRDLKENNDREWFTPRKEIYQEKLMQPMLELVSAIHAEMLRFAPEHVGEPKKTIFRIYRDTRFAKDKTPYKTNIGAAMWRASMQKGGGAGFYVSLSASEIEVGGGLYNPDPALLLPVRQAIAENFEEFQPLFGAAKVKKLMGGLWGESTARPPKGFAADHPAMEVLKHKHFVLMAELDPALALTPKLLPEIVKRFEAIAPFIDFLNRPLLAHGKETRLC